MDGIEGYKQCVLDRPGIFKGWPMEWTFEESTKSRSAAIVYHFAITEEWLPDERTWRPWDAGFWVQMRSWIIKSDGSPNDTTHRMLADAGLWDGDYMAIAGQPPQVVCILRVESEEFPRGSGTMQQRVNWADANADEPRAGGGGGRFVPADKSLLESYRARFAGQTRAIMGGKRGAAPPPPAPPRPPFPQASANGAIPGFVAPPPQAVQPNRPPFPVAPPPIASARGPNPALAVPTPDGGTEQADMSRFDLPAGTEPPF